MVPLNFFLNSDHDKVQKLFSNWKNNRVVTLFPRDININQLGVRSLFGVYLFMSLRKMLITWLAFQLGNCFYTFSCTEFNEEFSGTIRFYLSPLFCWENVQKQIVTCCEILKTFLKLKSWYLTYFKVDL